MISQDLLPGLFVYLKYVTFLDFLIDFNHFYISDFVIKNPLKVVDK